MRSSLIATMVLGLWSSAEAQSTGMVATSSTAASPTCMVLTSPGTGPHWGTAGTRMLPPLAECPSGACGPAITSPIIDGIAHVTCGGSVNTDCMIVYTPQGEDRKSVV